MLYTTSQVVSPATLTGKVGTPLESLYELRSHLDQLPLCLLKLMPPSVHSNCDETLYPVGVHGVEDITQPLLVQVVPVTLIRDVLEQGGLGTGVGEEVISSETLDLRYGSYLH